MADHDRLWFVHPLFFGWGGRFFDKMFGLKFAQTRTLRRLDQIGRLFFFKKHFVDEHLF